MTDSFHKALLDLLYDAVFFVDGERRITYWNKAAEELTGFTSQEVLGSKCGESFLAHVDCQGAALCGGSCPLAQTLADVEERESELVLRHKQGHRIPVSVRVAPVFDDGGRPVGAVQIFRDISVRLELRSQLEEMKEQAFLDPLTGLANRRYLDRHLRQRMDEYDRRDAAFGVMYFDIDRFKAVNDRHGHGVGDDVLKMVARTLASNTRLHDLVGRWGGEEFLSVASRVDYRQLLAIAERQRIMVERCSLSVPPDVAVTVSVGAALAVRGESVDALLQRADELLYQAKKSGRNQVCG
jgi:diguanylate cyclase (GGDEF)-like protein/PAS domain S-box-containing protein